jgi:hypothetical protein
MKVPSSDSELSLNRLIHSASDVSNVNLEGSLKANVSLQSLSDRNMRDIETFRQGASQSSVHNGNCDRLLQSCSTNGFLVME